MRRSLAVFILSSPLLASAGILTCEQSILDFRSGKTHSQTLQKSVAKIPNIHDPLILGPLGSGRQAQARAQGKGEISIEVHTANQRLSVGGRDGQASLYIEDSGDRMAYYVRCELTE